MTRKAFEKAISLDAEVDLETVTKVLEAMEDLVFEVVALEDSIKFSFGTQQRHETLERMLAVLKFLNMKV